MFAGAPSSTEIMCGTRTTTGTVITVPAGSWYTGSVMLSASVSVAGNSSPTVTVNGTNAAPAAGTVVARINLVGLALSTVADSCYIDILVKAPDENSVTIDFTAGASGTSSVSINGFIFG